MHARTPDGTSGTATNRETGGIVQPSGSQPDCPIVSLCVRKCQAGLSIGFPALKKTEWRFPNVDAHFYPFGSFSYQAEQSGFPEPVRE